jgi:hypothetical protein
MFRNIIRPSLALTALLAISFLQANAMPTIGQGKKRELLKTAAGCDPATATIELDINNVRARLMTGGDMWWNQGTTNAAYEIPKGTKKNSLFAGSVWVGGFTADKQLKVCAQTYRNQGNDYWPGPLYLNAGGYTTDKATCSDWDRFWKIDRATINRFRQLTRTGGNTQTAEFDVIWQWPAQGNGVGGLMNNNSYKRATGTSGLPLTMENREYAPFVNNPNDPGNNTELYEPERGDFPGDPTIGDLLGDQYIWWVFNDRGNTKGQTKTESIGMEVQTGAFAFASKDFMNDATFYNYHLINHGTSNLDSTFMATWTDADLGYALDDYIGCDTVRGLGILYNGDGFDGAGEATSYGSDLPMVGVDFFRGPHKYIQISADSVKDSVLKMTAFTYFNNGNDSRIGDPTKGVEFYNYMTGTSRNGSNFNRDYVSPGVPTTALGAGPDTRFVFTGEPDGSGPDQWSECVCQNPPYDRRFIHSAGPFVLYPGNVNDITIGAVWVSDVGGCPNTSFKKIRLADDQAQALFDNNFKTIEGPEAPLLTVRELDRKLVFYLSNPVFSTNFLEKFGYAIDSSKYRVRSLKAKNAGSADTLYKFEGYRVFQLKNKDISISQIFNERGEVNNDLAVEVFQTDIKNGISQVTNWVKDINIKNCTDTCWYPSIKVNGKDSGIIHSFEITQDKFATGNDQRIVNYKNYYFVAVAYAYNNFANFDPGLNAITQDVVYLESAHGPGGSPIEVHEVMPNPFSNNVGTYITSDYGDGVLIRRVEGVGNGGNYLQMTQESEEEALSPANSYQSAQPVYERGQGPADVKIVDPMKVIPGSWSLYIKPDLSLPGPYADSPTATSIDRVTRLKGEKAQWVLVNDATNQTIVSERNIDVLNEQILADYGLSIAVKQDVRPGDNQPEGNGLIGGSGQTSSKIIFADPAVTWLAGVNDGEQLSPLNWIRSGGYTYVVPTGGDPLPCSPNDYGYDTAGQFYENLLGEYSFTRGTWAPYSLASSEERSGCYLGVAKSGTVRALNDLQGVDVVFTSDKSKWTRSLVLEMNGDHLGEGGVDKFKIRSHRSWNMDMNNDQAVYSSSNSDTGFSYFPGYAINVETGERLNIVFGEDSYLSSDNGRDMIWNPSSTVLDGMGNSIFGGRHYIYVSNTRYDSCSKLATLLRSSSPRDISSAFVSFIWVGLPTVNTGFSLLSLKDGLIPTMTRVGLRVTRPYGNYIPPGIAPKNSGWPLYTFSTDALSPKKLADAANPYSSDKQALLDRIFVVPNPYYANSPSYEANRLDTRVRIINLPQRATVTVYSLDGTLIRKIDKDNNQAYVDWDIRNAKGLPIASGMYLVHVNAEGIGEKIIRWFGAMRPIDITQY